MVAPEHARLRIAQQCERVGISRSNWYYRPRGESELNLRPSYDIGRKRVRRLMRLMGLRSVAPQPGTSRPAPGHKVYPYLQRDVSIKRQWRALKYECVAGLRPLSSAA